MPVRATKRGSERTPLGGEFDVVVCGASFAGLAVARELFRDADALARALPGPVRPGVRIAVAVYVRVLDRVERHDYDVLTRSPALRPWEAAGAAAAGLTP